MIATPVSAHPSISTNSPAQYSFKVVRTYPHNPELFTEGLVYENGYFYESTGLRGKSKLLKIVASTGKVELEKKLPPQYFGEGMTIIGDKVYQLTYTSGLGFIYNKRTFKLTNTFHYKTEGWGLTHDGNTLIMSDGSANLCFLSSKTFKKIRCITAHSKDKIIRNLNELEWIHGKIYANIFTKRIIAIINPKNGNLIGFIDLRKLQKPSSDPEAVMNGTAYNAKTHDLIVTGKYWPKLYEIYPSTPEGAK